MYQNFHSRAIKFNKVATALAMNLLAAVPLALTDSENPVLQPPRVQLPNDVEQLAMYCATAIKLRRSDLAALSMTPVEPTDDPEVKKLMEDSDAIVKKVIAKLDDDLNRVNLFLLPRMRYLEPDAMLAAYSRGEADFATQQ